jgi:hypothetical protein
MSANLQEETVVTPEFIDEFARLHEFLAPYLADYEFMKKVLVKEVANKSGVKPVSLTGFKFALDYSAPTIKSALKITQADLFALAGLDVFTVSVTKAKEKLSLEDFNSAFAAQVESRRFKRVRSITLTLV